MLGIAQFALPRGLLDAEPILALLRNGDCQVRAVVLTAAGLRMSIACDPIHAPLFEQRLRRLRGPRLLRPVEWRSEPAMPQGA